MTTDRDPQGQDQGIQPRITLGRVRLIDHCLLAVLVSLSDLSAEEPTHTATLAEIAQHSCVPAPAVHERMARLAEGGFVSLQTLEV